MSDTTVVESDQTVTPPVTLEDLAQRLDNLGEQMNWLCENLASLFTFVNAMSSNGGGMRGLMKTLKQQQPPELGDVS
jgi:hypothetical protein